MATKSTSQIVSEMKKFNENPENNGGAPRPKKTESSDKK